MIGLMEGNMTETGKIIKWKELGFLVGQMGENMKGSIKMIKNMAMECLNGLMVLIKIFFCNFVLFLFR